MKTDYVTNCLIIAREGDGNLFTPESDRVHPALDRYAIVPIELYQALSMPPSKALAKAQAEDEGLWFVARTASEAYLQQELRKLHAAIEGEKL